MKYVAETSSHRRSSDSYVYRHIVGFEETNVVGNVYFTRHVSWQGKCREMFLRDFAPAILDDLRGDLRLITLRCSCEYYAELQPFDEVEVAMRLVGVTQNRISLAFDYTRGTADDAVAVASGAQDLACMRLSGGNLISTDVPPDLHQALEPFRATSLPPYSLPSS